MTLFLRALLWTCCLWLLAAWPAHAQSSLRNEQVQVELLAHAPQGVQPGQTLWLGLQIRHAPHWHTYWQNPGDSGLPTQLQWQLPAGLQAGEIAWPLPKKIPIGTLANYGYEDTVLPQLENALLAGHDVIFLGERGQAKTRMIRSLVGLLDEWMPIVAGSEINDDPYHPVSRYARELVAELGDDTRVEWVHRSSRFGEKLATSPRYGTPGNRSRNGQSAPHATPCLLFRDCPGALNGRGSRDRGRIHRPVGV